MLMEIYDYVEHTDAIVPKSWVKGQETLSQINSAATYDHQRSRNSLSSAISKPDM